MRRLVKYLVLSGTTTSDLSAKVTEYLNEGWWLWQGTFFDAEQWAYQTMVLPVDVKEGEE